MTYVVICMSCTFAEQVVAGDEPDSQRPSEKGSGPLREHCDESLLDRSFALQFKERSLEVRHTAVGGRYSALRATMPIRVLPDVLAVFIACETAASSKSSFQDAPHPPKVREFWAWRTPQSCVMSDFWF